MATKDLWNPGYKFARTLKGHETAIPPGLTLEEEASFLNFVDKTRAEDPEAIARDKRNSRRRANWERQQAPARAWRKHFQETYLDSPGGFPPDFNHEAERAKFVKNFIAERNDRERKERAKQVGDELTALAADLKEREEFPF